MHTRVSLPRTAVLAAALLAAGAAADTLTINDGVYTAAQARSGARVHVQHCARCHHQSYYQDAFLDPWRDQSLAALYELIRMKMPEDRPGALRPREYSALIAWMLELNGYPAGERTLGPGPEALRHVLVAPRRPRRTSSAIRSRAATFPALSPLRSRRKA
jgi:S-disulfanyl-L-cysteine oxidoreductase SoxD